MAEKAPERQASGVVTLARDRSDISEELFGAYKREYLEERKTIQEEAWYSLEALKRGLKKILPSSPEKPKEPMYDALKLSQLGKKFFDMNHEKLKLENPETTTILIYLQGSDGRKSEARYLSIPRTNPTNKPIPVNGFTFTPTPKSNGYNTEYIITGPDGKEWTQLAVFFPATNPKFRRKGEAQKELSEKRQKLAEKLGELSKEKDKKKKEAILADIRKLQKKIQTLPALIASYGEPEQYTHFSYIPYREAFDTPEIQKAGFNYLKSSMIGAYQYRNPETGNPVSSIYNEATKIQIHEELPWQFPFILNLVERMDFEEYFARPSRKELQPKEVTDPLMRKQLGRALTTFGVNTKDAFNWQGSNKDAHGVGQMLPSTYNIYRKHKKYGPFFPEEDFDIASSDHNTSFRLQITHFDDQIYQFPKAIQSNWKTLLADPHFQAPLLGILAAGYNGSMSRIVYEVFGEGTGDINECKRRLNITYITKAMERARDLDIREIENESIQKPRLDKKTKKMVQPPPLPLTKDQKDRIQKRYATYKESMTYVLKADFVWKQLKGGFSKEF